MCVFQRAIDSQIVCWLWFSIVARPQCSIRQANFIHMLGARKLVIYVGNLYGLEVYTRIFAGYTGAQVTCMSQIYSIHD